MLPSYLGASYLLCFKSTTCALCLFCLMLTAWIPHFTINLKRFELVPELETMVLILRLSFYFGQSLQKQYPHDLGSMWSSLTPVYRNYYFFYFDNSTQKCHHRPPLASASSNCLICAQLFLIPSIALSYLLHSSFLSKGQLLHILCTWFKKSCMGWGKGSKKLVEFFTKRLTPSPPSGKK